MGQVKMQSVDSSNIANVGYASEKKELYVNFHNGGSYKYYPITEQGYKELINADSVGSYFHKNIRNNSAVTTEKLN